MKKKPSQSTNLWNLSRLRQLRQRLDTGDVLSAQDRQFLQKLLSDIEANIDVRALLYKTLRGAPRRARDLLAVDVYILAPELGMKKAIGQVAQKHGLSHKTVANIFAKFRAQIEAVFDEPI